MILLISLPFAYGLIALLTNKTIYDFSLYHIYIFSLVENFVKNVIKNLGIIGDIILISSFIIEMIMILVFLEIIEINLCGLNENLKRNIESRGIIESTLINEDDDNDEIDDLNGNNNENNE